MTLLVVTGTGTGVGKTVVTAALAALTLARGARCAVVKPAQTGEADDGVGNTSGSGGGRGPSLPRREH